MGRFRIPISDEVIGVRSLALLTGAMGIVNVLAAVRPSMQHRLRLLEMCSPLQVTRGGHRTSALAGFALLMLASDLWRRKRVAWLLTLLVLLGSIVVHLVRQAISTMMAALLFTLAYSVTGFFLLDRHLRVSFGFWAALRQTVVMFTQFYDPGLDPIAGFGRYFADSIYVVAIVTMGYSLLLLIRLVLARRGALAAERARAREIVREFGRTSLARSRCWMTSCTISAPAAPRLPMWLKAAMLWISATRLDRQTTYSVPSKASRACAR